MPDKVSSQGFASDSGRWYPWMLVKVLSNFGKQNKKSVKFIIQEHKNNSWP